MKITLILLPVISAFIGWFTIWLSSKILFHPKVPIKIFGITIQGIFPKKQQQLAEKIGEMVSKELFSFSVLENKIADPHNIEKLMPYVETHIDHFLRVKLADEMPMISMFIGDKTINQMKAVFIKELHTLFPLIMANYLGQLKSDLDIEKMVIEKVNSIPSEKLEIMFLLSFSKELRFTRLFFTALGFMIGLIQAFILIIG